jgi:predicted membrane-bound mannosyltransferase
VGLAFALRASRLEQPGLWHDEVASARYALASPGEAFRASGSLDPHPPLYWLLQATVRPLGDGEGALRAPSVGCGVAAVLLVGLQRRRGGGTALVPALWLALNPVHVLFSREARSYALVVLLTLAGSLVAVRCVGTRRVPASALALWTIAAVLAFWTHFLTALVVAVQGALLLWAASRSDGDRARRAHLRRHWPASAVDRVMGAPCPPNPSILLIPYIITMRCSDPSQAPMLGSCSNESEVMPHERQASAPLSAGE